MVNKSGFVVQSIILLVSFGSCKFPESRDHVLFSSANPTVPNTVSSTQSPNLTDFQTIQP